MASTTIESSETPDIVTVPEVHHELSVVLSQVKASGLPPHRPHDYAIVLLLGTYPPCNYIYSLPFMKQHAI